jgi:hypothetical protein
MWPVIKASLILPLVSGSPPAPRRHRLFVFKLCLAVSHGIKEGDSGALVHAWPWESRMCKRLQLLGFHRSPVSTLYAWPPSLAFLHSNLGESISLQLWELSHWLARGLNFSRGLFFSGIGISWLYKLKVLRLWLPTCQDLFIFGFLWNQSVFQNDPRS